MTKDEYIRYLEDKLKIANNKISKYEKLMDQHKIKYKEESKEILSSEEKLRLFMYYFIGREDVFALRWERDGKSGYSPAYNEEYKYLKKEEKGKIGSSDLYRSISKEDYYNHLKGRHVLGLYPNLKDATCNFLAIDFDEESWKKDSLAFYRETRKNGFDALLEISRSGKGAHVWVFFVSPISSELARRFGRYILTDTMNNSRSISLNSYDRMFPAQDYVSDKQIGNLIALPLNGKSGTDGNTLFVDEEFIPYTNQYRILSECKKISSMEVKEFVIKKDKASDVGPLSTRVRMIDITNIDFGQPFVIVLDNEIRTHKSILNYKCRQFLIRLSSLSNPQFYKNEKMRISNFNVPRIIQLYKEDLDYIYLPIGVVDELKSILVDKNILFEIDDLRGSNDIDTIKTDIKLRANQKNAFLDIIKHTNGLVVAPTGFGKTILGIELISKLKQRTLIITNRVNLCEQWYKRILSHTDVSEIGRFYSKYKELDKDINIATFQSLMKNDDLNQIRNNFGLILIDEVHHLAAFTFEKVIRNFSSKYIFGFTATPTRADGLEKITKMLIGDIIVDVKIDNSLLNKSLITHFTSFKSSNGLQVTDMLSRLTVDSYRNDMIISDIKKAYGNQKNILVLTDRIDHLNELEKHLSKTCDNLIVIHGRMGVKQKKNFYEELHKVTGKFIILSTGKFIGEGFDDERLDTLFLTMPFRWKGTLSQYVGRLNRTSNEIKYITVHDYLDIHIKMFSNMYIDRLKGYKQQGFVIDESQSKTQSVFNKHNYDEKLLDDIINSKISVRFIMRYSHDKRVEFLSKNVHTNLVTTINEKDDKTKYLNVIIIDDRILWYGSINPFTFNSKEEETILRIEDGLIVKEILE